METAMKNAGPPAWSAPYANIRTDGYIILAALLGQAPSEDLVNVLQNLQWDEAVPEKLGHTLEVLRQASHDYALDSMRDEYNRLFTGLGRSEIMPYASWYRERMIQSSPLVSLRSDLIALGIVKQSDNCEPEDHAAALCEIMVLISQSDKVSYGTQAKFFERHLAPWMISFFRDLESAKDAPFYQVVGLLGRCLLESEDEYLGCSVDAQRASLRAGYQAVGAGALRESY
jgi:TorA maturation chaperone TorD